MIDFTQINLNDLFEATNFGTYPFTGIYFIIISICIICFLPNAYQFILKYNELYKSFNKHIPNQPNTKRKVIWKPSVFWGFCFALILILSIMNISSTNEFLYFEF